MLHHEAKREVEEAIFESALDFTILQTARMMHNIAPAWNNITRSGMYVEPFSCDVPIADVDYDDVAEVAALALTRDGFGRATFELCADGMLNRHQRAALLGAVIGPRSKPDPARCDWLQKAGITDPYEQEARARMFRYYDDFGLQGGNGFVLRSLLGLEPATFQQFLERTVRRLNSANA
ncbi:MAG: hypothetical protein HHJ12_16990 [Glaciimonas sp.]|nr:hypothetical protein [Glaciimonas sp.]